MANFLTRFDPFSESLPLDPIRSMEKLMRNFPVALPEEPLMKMDVTETDDKYTVKAEIPGVKKDDIKISVDRNQVSISAEVKNEHEEKKDGNLVRSERYYGRQYRSFSLAHEIDEGKADANYHDGVLELLLPKKPGNGGSRQIAVK